MTENTALRYLRKSTVYFVLIGGAIIMLFPLLWTLSTSLKAKDAITSQQIELIPNPAVWENYLTLFNTQPVFLYMRNSLVVVAAALFGGLIVCSLVAYAFAFIRFPGRDLLFNVLLITMMIPFVVQLIPIFLVFDRLGWVNTFLPLIVPRLLGHNAFYIFLYRQFFRSIPPDLLDAARLDGCTEIGLWRRIVLPISVPVLAAVAVFSFQFAWNDFLNPLIYVGGNRDLWTLPIGLQSFTQLEGQQSNMNLMMAMAIVMIAPIIALFAVAQRYVISGVGASSGIRG